MSHPLVAAAGKPAAPWSGKPPQKETNETPDYSFAFMFGETEAEPEVAEGIAVPTDVSETDETTDATAAEALPELSGSPSEGDEAAAAALGASTEPVAPEETEASAPTDPEIGAAGTGEPVQAATHVDHRGSGASAEPPDPRSPRMAGDIADAPKPVAAQAAQQTDDTKIQFNATQTQARADGDDVPRAGAETQRVEATSPGGQLPTPASSAANAQAPAAVVQAQVAGMTAEPLAADPLVSSLNQETALSGVSTREMSTPQMDLTRASAFVPQRVSEQVIRLIQNADPRAGTELELRLDPPELGRVRISFSGLEGSLTATLSVERPEIEALIRRHAEQLQQSLIDAGFDGASLNFASHGPNGDRNDNQPGAVLAMEDASADQPSQMNMPRKGLVDGQLDIRL